MNMRLLTIPFILFILSCYVAKGQENIALIAAEIETSYVSSWENLDAINNNIDPTSSGDKTGGAYGNWNQAANFNKWNWVQYDFSTFYKIVRSEVYWWTDGGGIQIPYDSYLQYWDFVNSKWITINEPVGVDANRYNVTRFDTVVTNKIRLNFISVAAQGILEWKVYGIENEAIPSLSTASINTPLAPATTSTITLTAFDKNEELVPGYVFEINAQVSSCLSQNLEIYSVNGISIQHDSLGIKLPPTGENGQTSFDVSLPALIDPADGISINVFFKGRLAKLKSYSYFTPGMEVPALTADATLNTVDYPIEISFNEDNAWRAAVYEVKANGTILGVNDYSLESGALILKPLSGNSALTNAGRKEVVVSAWGYKKDTVYQDILCGQINAEMSYVDSTTAVYRPSNTQLKLYAKDRFGNPISGYKFKYQTIVTNLDASVDEKYKLDGTEIYSNSEGETVNATNTDGLLIITFSTPVLVDLNDGIKINFLLSDGTTFIKGYQGYFHRQGEKGIYLPNELDAHQNEWSWDKTAQSENFIIFWGNKSGTDPLHPTGGAASFDPHTILASLESYYTYYLDSMHFIPNPDEGNMSKYKFFVVAFNTWNSGYEGTTAYGGSTDGVIGAMWVPINGGGFVFAHEFGHAFCAMIPIQLPGKGFLNDSDSHQVGMFWEACANYMAFEVTGQPGNIQTTHFMNTAMMQYLSTVSYRQYETSFIPFIIEDQYGYDGYSKMWQSAEQGDHPVDALAKGLGVDRDSALNVMGLYAMKNVNWDYKGIGPIMRSYLDGLDASETCRKFTYPDKLNDGSDNYIVPREVAPGDFGYNIIPLFPNEGATQIKVKLTGIDNENANGAGWRLGIVAIDGQGKSNYSAVYKEGNEVTYTIQPDDNTFYLTVIATPPVSHTYSWDPGYPKVYRYPYLLNFTNVLPAGSKDGYNSQKEIYPGASHANGGGWVANTADVASTAYVGPNAQVLGTAKVSGNARITDFALVTGTALVYDSAIVSGNAIVGGSARIYGKGRVEKSARVYGGKVYENAVVTGSSVLFNCKLSGQSVTKDLAWLSSVTLSGTAIVGGDLESFATCSEGIYLQNARNSCDKKLWLAKNDDVNSEPDYYTYPIGDIPSKPEQLKVKETGLDWATFTFNESQDNSKVTHYLVMSGTKPLGLISSASDTLFGLTPATAYSFFIRAIDDAGNVSEISNVADGATSIYDNPGHKSLNVQLFPNPANSSVTISTTNINESHLTIFNCLGKAVLQADMTNSLVLDKAQIGPAGIYFVELKADGETITRKLIITN